MATLSKDVTKGAFDRSNNYSRRVYGYTGPTSYATGGDTLTPEQCALASLPP